MYISNPLSSFLFTIFLSLTPFVFLFSLNVGNLPAWRKCGWKYITGVCVSAADFRDGIYIEIDMIPNIELFSPLTSLLALMIRVLPQNF